MNVHQRTYRWHGHPSLAHPDSSNTLHESDDNDSSDGEVDGECGGGSHNDSVEGECDSSSGGSSGGSAREGEGEADGEGDGDSDSSSGSGGESGENIDGKEWCVRKLW